MLRFTPDSAGAAPPAEEEVGPPARAARCRVRVGVAARRGELLAQPRVVAAVGGVAVDDVALVGGMTVTGGGELPAAHRRPIAEPGGLAAEVDHLRVARQRAI